jgi:hypothetical protein
MPQTRPRGRRSYAAISLLPDPIRTPVRFLTRAAERVMEMDHDRGR